MVRGTAQQAHAADGLAFRASSIRGWRDDWRWRLMRKTLNG